MLKFTKKHRLLSLVIALVVIGSMLFGAVVPGLASGNEPVGYGLQSSAQYSSVTISDENVTVTLTQTEANLISVSGALADSAAEVYGGELHLYAGDYAFTLKLNSSGEIVPRTLSVDYEHCSSLGNTLSVRVSYSLKVSGRYELKTTASQSFGVVTYIPAEPGVIGAPAGTTYISTDQTPKPLNGSSVPDDVLKDEYESFVVIYNGCEIVLKNNLGGLSQTERAAKKQFEELYASLADKLYDRLTETVEITPDELKTLTDAYNELPYIVKVLSSIRDKYKNVVLSEFVVLNMDILVKSVDEVTKDDALAIDKALLAFDELFDSDKTFMAEDYNDLIAKRKKLAIDEINEISVNGGTEVGASAEEYIAKIEASSVDTAAEIDALVEEFKSNFVDIVRNEALAELEDRYNEILASADYAGFTNDSKNAIFNAYNDAVNAITSAQSGADVKAALADGKLALDRSEAKAKISASVESTDSAEVLGIVNTAYGKINAETEKSAIDAIVEKTLLDMVKQRAKEEVADYVGSLNFPIGHESLVEGVFEDGCTLIDGAQNEEEIALAVEKAKALLDLTEAYLVQLETIEATDPSAQNKQNVLTSAYEKAAEKVKAAVGAGDIATARSEGLVSINGAIVNAHRITFYETHKDILDKTEITKDDLAVIDAALKDMKDNYTSDEQDTLDDYRDALLSKKKTAVIDAINGKKNGSAFDTQINAYVGEISGLDILGGTADDGVVNARIDAIYADVLTTAELNAKRDALRAELTAKVRDLKNSGKYNTAQQGELEAVLAAVLADLDALALTVDNVDDTLSSFRTEAVAKIMAVKVSCVAIGELTPNGDNSAKDYTDGYSTLVSGFWATVKNDNGMPGASALTAEQMILKPFTVKSYKVATGELDDAKASEAVTDKKALITFKLGIKADGNAFASENNGIYTVTLLLPKSLRDSTGLYVVSYNDAGETLIYNTRKEGNFLVFDTDTLTEFTVIGDKSVNLIWVAFLLGGIFLAEAISSAVLIIKRKKNGGNKMYSFALPMLAVVFTPAGIIPAIAVLGALTVIGGGVLAFQVKKNRSASKAEEAEETAENAPETSDESINDVTEMETENVEAVADDTPEEIVEEGIPVEEKDESQIEIADEKNVTENETENVEAVAEETTEEEAPVEEKDDAQIEIASEGEIEAVIEPEKTEEEEDSSKKILILPVVDGESEENEEEAAENDESDEEEIAVALPDDAEGDDEEDKKVFSGIFGDRIYVTYDYSFESKLVQSSEDVQRRYYELSELLLSYKVNKRRSWKKERYFLKGKSYVHMIFRGKTLCLCLAIAPESLEGTKYSFENVGDVKKYESVPVMIRVRSARGCKYASELIRMMLDGAGIEQKHQPKDNFELLPYEDKQQLVDRGAIKMLMTDGSGDVVNADFEAMKSGKFSIMSEGMPIMKRVSAEDVAAIPDEAATPFVETELESEDDITYGRRKGIINIDTISAAFEDGDVVTISALKAKHLVPKNIHFVKVLARGILDKSLTVKAHDFSMDAVKMIVIAGGNVVKLKFKRI